MKPCSLLPPSSGKKRGRPIHGPTPTSTTAGAAAQLAVAADVADIGSLIKIDEKINNPVDFLKSLFSLSDTTKKWMEKKQRKNPVGFGRPSEDAVEAYDLIVVRAIRERNVDKLRAMLEEGRKFDASNRFGESLIHMACRRGDLGVIQFLIDEANVRLDVADDFGRTPLHDACWTSKPNLDVVGLLLKKIPPSMLLMEDVRGHTPFCYARKEHRPTWVAFLRDNAHHILQRVSIVQAIELLD
ncbi:ANK [Seminavis robusta]|uniref:ANK n=1 Tax=Seminavis robusta TaxID=568900 RepID=A0A9N8DZ97_9STRA|nr:ANK [Seminavis robusta]|eukprot:Sro470_g149570.1 ANK (242) ;mRNA; f:45235-45960